MQCKYFIKSLYREKSYKNYFIKTLQVLLTVILLFYIEYSTCTQCFMKEVTTSSGVDIGCCSQIFYVPKPVFQQM